MFPSNLSKSEDDVKLNVHEISREKLQTETRNYTLSIKTLITNVDCSEVNLLNLKDKHSNRVAFFFFKEMTTDDKGSTAKVFWFVPCSNAEKGVHC